MVGFRRGRAGALLTAGLLIEGVRDETEQPLEGAQLALGRGLQRVGDNDGDGFIFEHGLDG